MTHQTSLIPGDHGEDIKRLLASSSAKLPDADIRQAATRRALLAAAAAGGGAGSHGMSPACTSAVEMALLARAGGFTGTGATSYLGGRSFINNNLLAAQQVATMKPYTPNLLSSLLGSGVGVVGGGGGSAMDAIILEAAIRRLEMECQIQLLQTQNFALNGGNPLLPRTLDQQQQQEQQQDQLRLHARPDLNQLLGRDSTSSSKQGPLEGSNSATEAAAPQSPAVDPSDAKPRIRGGVTEPFPEKLHRMLTELSQSGEGSNVISFFPHGKAFLIHDPTRFANQVMPKYFNKQSRLSSFQRQLNLYGFTRIKSGPDFGGYFHELFVKDRPDLCTKMRRVGAAVKSNSSENRTNNKNNNEISSSSKSSASDKGKESTS